MERKGVETWFLHTRKENQNKTQNTKAGKGGHECLLRVLVCNAREWNFTSLGLLPLLVSVTLIVPVSVCAVGKKMDL